MCYEDPFEDSGYYLRSEILANPLIRVNFIIFTIWIIRSVNNWFRSNYSDVRELNIHQEVTLAVSRN